MSTGKPNKRPKGYFAGITTLHGMSHQEQIDFSWNDLRRFFKVTLWDKSHLCTFEDCPIKGREIATFDEATLDHIVPKSRGGHTRLANLQLMHSKCNSRKTNRMPERYSPKAFQMTRSNIGSRQQIFEEGAV